MKINMKKPWNFISIIYTQRTQHTLDMLEYIDKQLARFLTLTVRVEVNVTGSTPAQRPPTPNDRIKAPP